MTIESGPIRMTVLLIAGEHVSLHGEYCDFDDGTRCKINELADDILDDLIAIGAVSSEPRVPTGYTAEELDRDNPYNQWMYES